MRHKIILVLNIFPELFVKQKSQDLKLCNESVFLKKHVILVMHNFILDIVMHNFILIFSEKYRYFILMKIFLVSLLP